MKKADYTAKPVTRRWLLKQLKQLREDIRADTRVVLQEVLSDDVRLAMLAAMTEGQNRQVQ